MTDKEERPFYISEIKRNKEHKKKGMDHDRDIKVERTHMETIQIKRNENRNRKTDSVTN